MGRAIGNDGRDGRDETYRGFVLTVVPHTGGRTVGVAGQPIDDIRRCRADLNDSVSVGGCSGSTEFRAIAAARARDGERASAHSIDHVGRLSRLALAGAYPLHDAARLRASLAHLSHHPAEPEPDRHPHRLTAAPAGGRCYGNRDDHLSIQPGLMLKVGAGASLRPFLAMDVAARANVLQATRGPADPRVLRLEVGQPATGAPRPAVAAVQRALAAGTPLGYTDALGLPSLRARLAAHYRSFYAVPATVPPDRIVVTTGASGGFLLAFLAAFDPGDRIALASPYYPPYVNILHALSLHAVVLPTGPETRYQPTVAHLEAMAAGGQGLPDGLIVASPGNPAGTCLDADELAALAGYCHHSGIRLVSDEIYHGLNWDGPPATACALSGSAIVVSSFSKYWSMTGWRVGWAVLPEDLVAPVLRLKQNLFISAPHVSQIAAEAALDAEAEIATTLAGYRRARAHLLDALPAAGFAHLSPAQGAFYLYVDIGARSQDSVGFCARLLAEAGIAATPGIDFDAVRGHRHVRLSYCGPEADMIEAAHRLAAFDG